MLGKRSPQSNLFSADAQWLGADSSEPKWRPTGPSHACISWVRTPAMVFWRAMAASCLAMRISRSCTV